VVKKEYLDILQAKLSGDDIQIADRFDVAYKDHLNNRKVEGNEVEEQEKEGEE